MPIRELTDDECNRLLLMVDILKLPNGTRVMVKWSGGNGPHEYEIAHHHKLGLPGVCTSKPFPIWHELTFVGKENFHTRVFTIEGTE